MKQSIRFKHASMILTLYAIGIAEAYFLQHYGIEWLLAGLAATVFLGSSWMRARWN